MRIRIFTVGILAAFMACNTGDKPSDSGETGPVLPAPQPITFTIDGVYPHDSTAFTQGLEFHNGKLYEGTGQLGESTLRITDPKTGKVEKKYLIPDPDIFGEGITLFKNKIYQLTWQNNKIYVYNQNDITKPIKTLSWKSEGWGITHDNNYLIISDGITSNIYFALPDEEKNEMRIIKSISVADNTGALDNINELEYIDGFIYANRWQTDDILKIDTASGHVVGKMNLTGLLAQYDAREMNSNTDVLNGIAYDSATKKLYITGKRWPRMFEVRINK
jgi:glutamine cyclotransferase